MLQLNTRGVARVAAATLLLLAATACGSECDDFYNTFEGCNPDAEAGDAAVDDCNERLEASDSCEAAYKNLNACIDDLDEACTYTSACIGELESANLSCTNL